MREDISALWKQMEGAHETLMRTLGQFFKGDESARLAFLREQYNGNRNLVLFVLQYLPQEELKKVLPFLLEHARSVHGHLHKVREIILTIPKEWLVDHIEAAADPLLESATYDDYRRFLELYFAIDLNLTERLARRAKDSADPDIKEAGEDFMEKIREAARA